MTPPAEPGPGRGEQQQVPPPTPRRPGRKRRAWIIIGVVVLLIVTVAAVVARRTVSDTHPAPGPTTEQAALDALHPGCTEDNSQLDAEAKKALVLLQSRGIRDETVTTLLVHLRETIPASTTNLDCNTALGTYIATRSTGG